VRIVKGEALVSGVSIALGVLVLLHHLLSTGRLFDVEDILHHEFFVGVFIAFGIGVLLFRMKSRQ